MRKKLFGNFYPGNSVERLSSRNRGNHKGGFMRQSFVRFALAVAAGAFLTMPNLTFAQANPCAGKNPCAATKDTKDTKDKKAEKQKAGKDAKNTKGAENPCSAKNPCAAKK